MMSDSPLPTILKPTDRPNEPIKNSRPISESSAPITQPNGQFLPSAEFHHNSAPHSSTKRSLFSLLYGFEPHSYPPLGKTFLPALEERLSHLDEAQKEALAAHDSTRKLMINRTTRSFTPWKTGDKVWLEATNLRLHYPNNRDPSKSSRYYLHSPTNSDFPPPGKYMTYSTLPFYLLIAPPNHMDHKPLLLHLTS